MNPTCWMFTNEEGDADFGNNLSALRDKSFQGGPIVPLYAEPQSQDAQRLDWLHAQLKLTIAYALGWPYIPQDVISFRAKLDDTIQRSKGRVV